MTITFEEYRQSHAKKSLNITKDLYKKNVLSFFGGCPVMPPSYEWPTYTLDGETRCMLFYGQIDIRDLPWRAADLTESGILYFFIGCMEDESSIPSDQFRVLFSPTYDDLVIKEPNGPIPIIGDYNFPGGWTFGSWDAASHLNVQFSTFPKYHLNFSSIEHVRYSYGLSDKDLEEGFLEKLNRFNECQRKLSLINLHGEQGAKQWIRKSWTDIHHQRLLEPTNKMPVSFFRQEQTECSPLLQDWPNTWLHISIYLSTFTNPESRSFKCITEIKDGAIFMEECEEWITLAKNNGWFIEVDKSNKQKFMAWLQSRFKHHYLEWGKTRGVDLESVSSAHQAVASGLNGTLRMSALDATSIVLGDSKAGASTLSENTINDFKGHLEPSWPHLIFGDGDSLDGVYDLGEDETLLLQLNADRSMLWTFYDCGALQFRIDKESLRQNKFENATLVIC